LHRDLNLVVLELGDGSANVLGRALVDVLLLAKLDSQFAAIEVHALELVFGGFEIEPTRVKG
jgi:hypothetical protein